MRRNHWNGSGRDKTQRYAVDDADDLSRRLEYFYFAETAHHKVVILTSTNKLHRLTERDSRLAHYFALFWSLGLFWAILLLPVQNLTSYSCSATPIS